MSKASENFLSVRMVVDSGTKWKKFTDSRLASPRPRVPGETLVGKEWWEKLDIEFDCAASGEGLRRKVDAEVGVG